MSTKYAATLISELRDAQGDGTDWTEVLFGRAADALESLVADTEKLQGEDPALARRELSNLTEEYVGLLAERDALRAQLDSMFERTQYAVQVGTWPPCEYQSKKIAQWYAEHPFTDQAQHEHKVVERRTLIGPWVEVSE